MPHTDLLSLIPKLKANRVLVVGDVILDEYLIGDATRMSREAPVPVLEFRERRLIPGGAANPAANIAALGATAVQIGLTGADEAADRLRERLSVAGIDASGLLIDDARPTTVKTRVMAHMGLRFPQQVARLDTLSRTPIDEATAARVLACIAEAKPADAILCSDYHTGLLTEGLVAAIRAGAGDTLLTADAQGALQKYRGFGVVKCNASEAAAYLGRDLSTDAAFAEAAETLFRQLGLAVGMVITRGGAGAVFYEPEGGPAFSPAPAVTDVFDVVGAGDTFIAVTTLALASGGSLAEAVAMANAASGLVVRKVGNYAPSPNELRRVLGGEASSAG